MQPLLPNPGAGIIIGTALFQTCGSHLMFNGEYQDFLKK